VKNRIVGSFVAATGLLLSVAAGAQENTPAVLRATLDNGLKVIIVRNTLAPVVTTQINYLAGSDEVPADFPGTAHAMEHMMFRGSPGLDKDQLSAIAANMGGSFNAETTQSVTQFYFEVPRQDLDVALRVDAIRMRGIDLAPAEWANERGAIEQEVARDLSSPEFKLYSEMQATLFQGTPYAHTPLGTRASFDKTTAGMLREYHNTWYQPNNAILVIAGDVDPAATMARVKTLFGDIPQKPVPAKPSFVFAPVKAKTVQLTTDSPYGSITIAYRLPGMQAKDYATAMLLGSALGSQRGDLYGMGMDGTALAGGFGMQFMPQAGFGMAEGVFPRGGDAQVVLKRMQAIMQAAGAKGVDPALLEAAKRQAISEMEFSKNSVTGLASSWSQAVAFAGADSPEALKASIEAVTPAEVNALAKRAFDPAHAITAILTPESSGKPVASKGFGGAENFASAPDKAVTLPDWAAQAFAKLEVPASALHPTSYVLANGLRLIVQPEDVSDTVQVYGRVKTNQDVQAPKGKDGVADVLEAAFAFGSSDMGRDPLQQALDNISARETAGFDFALAVPSAHFAEGVKLLADNELHPALTPQVFSIVRPQVAGAIAGQLQAPAVLTQIGFNKALLPASDPGQRYATPESVASLTLDNVQSYYNEAFRPDLTTIVIVGKIQPEQAKAIVEREFGSWHAAGTKPDVAYGAIPPSTSSQFNVPDKSAVQDSVQMSETVDVNQNSPQRFALELGNQVLGGGFYASRLYRDLREKAGLVYSVDSSFNLDEKRGIYSISFGSDPANVEKARSLVLHNLKKMQDEPISADDLNRVKGILLRQFALGEASFDGIGGGLLSLAVQGKPLDATTTASKHYLELSATDVQTAFRTYIRPGDFATGVQGP
jgi:zinc protease